jgi:oligoribonuclease NrnB/cAMP/cGMP phosphodiesterase (DHH superfamily)
MKPLCIYHGNCADGFGAAWAVRHALGDEVEFFAATHGKLPPDVKDRDLIIVDFSYPFDVMLVLLDLAKSITILDHHASAERELREMAESLADQPTIKVEFDMNRSGAVMAWEHFHPGQEVPRLLQHIQDRDLWRFALPHTKAISANLFSYPYDFPTWDTIVERFDWDDTAGMRYRAEFIAAGEAIVRKHAKDIDELLPATLHWWVIDGESVPIANLPYTFSSEAGHRLLELYPQAPFAGTYYDAPHGRVVSLRSENGRADVGAIAQRYRGGGHRNAAGFTISPDAFWTVRKRNGLMGFRLGDPAETSA